MWQSEIDKLREERKRIDWEIFAYECDMGDEKAARSIICHVLMERRCLDFINHLRAGGGVKVENNELIFLESPND